MIPGSTSNGSTVTDGTGQTSNPKVDFGLFQPAK